MEKEVFLFAEVNVTHLWLFYLTNSESHGRFHPQLFHICQENKSRARLQHTSAPLALLIKMTRKLQESNLGIFNHIY